MVSDRLAIETIDLWKRYGDVEALRGLDLQVPAGSICGFLGRNGAGKTTTIKVLLGMARATRARRACSAQPAGDAEVRRRVGFVSDEKDLYDYMTVEEIIDFTRPFFPKWRRDLEQKYRQKFELPGPRDIKDLSRGTRTKLALLLALCRGADLLILDEPTSGLDPAMAEDVLQALVGHVAGEEMTVFFSSHQIAEVDQIADHIAIVDRGRMVLPAARRRAHRYQRAQLVFAGEAPRAATEITGRGARESSRASAHDADQRSRAADGGSAIARAGLGRLVAGDVEGIFLESVRTED